VNNQSIYIISEDFYPSRGATAQLATELALGLIRSGYKIVVLTKYSGAYDDLGISTITFARSSSTGSVVHKSIRGILFSLYLIFWGLFRLERHSNLLIFSNPPFIGLCGTLLKLFKGSRYIFILQDLFPRSAVLSGILPPSGILTLAWRKLIKLACRHSSRTILLSQAMKDRSLLEYGWLDNVSVISNWALESKPPNQSTSHQIVSKWQARNHFVVLYSGNFGRLHEFITLLECARLTEDLPIKYIFAGKGAKFNHIKTYKEHFKLENVVIDEPCDLEALNSVIAIADLCVISLAPGSDDTVAPSKLYGILANGKPVLVISSSRAEIAQMVSKYNNGTHVHPGDIQTLRDRLVHLSRDKQTITKMGVNSFELYRSEYGLSKSLPKYIELLNTIPD